MKDCSPGSDRQSQSWGLIILIAAIIAFTSLALADVIPF